MAKWKIVSGARGFYQFPGRDVEIGWARDLKRRDDMRTVNVCVSREAATADELPDECRAAIRTHGRTVINAVLDEEIPPFIVDVTLTGLVYEYASEEDEDEEDEEDNDAFDDDEIDGDDDDSSDDDSDDEDLSAAGHDASTTNA